MPGERTTRTSWQGLFLSTVAMAHHFYVRATLAELEADALRAQRDAAVEDNAALLGHLKEMVRQVGDAETGTDDPKDVPGFVEYMLASGACEEPHPGTGYRARVRAELLRELAMERRAVMASGGVEVSNEALAEHLEAQAVEEEAAGRGK